MTLTSIAPFSVLTKRFLRTDVLVDTFIDINTSRSDSFVSVPAATGKTAYCICAMNIPQANSSILIALIKVYTFSVHQCKTQLTLTFLPKDFELELKFNSE